MGPKCTVGCAPSQFVPFATLLPAVTPFLQLNVLPDAGTTGRTLKCCTAPNRALIQFRVSPDPADGICAQNKPAPRTVCHHLVARTAEGLERGSTADGDSAAMSVTGVELQLSAVTCPMPLTPSTTNCKGPTTIGGCRTAQHQHSRSVRSAILRVACSKTQ
jgi:hypothetical protein